jgi:hypothetical protein
MVTEEGCLARNAALLIQIDIVPLHERFYYRCVARPYCAIQRQIVTSRDVGIDVILPQQQLQYFRCGFELGSLV